MPTLTIQLPGRSPVEHALRGEAITLGRALGNSIALENSSVSQSHARITRVGSDFFLYDLNSTNGTLLNGQSISEARLHDGDVLRLGEVVAIFELRPAVAPAPAPAAPTRDPVPISATRSEKSDTTVLSTKAKTALLKPVLPKVDVVPATPAPQRKSPVVLIAVVFSGLLMVGIVGFLAWKLVGGGTAKTTTPPESSPPTNTSVETVKPLPAAEPTMVPETPLPVADATNAPVRRSTNNLPELLATLRSSDVIERRHAAEAISALEPGATNALLNLRVALVQESDPEVRMWLVVALVNNQTYDQATIPVLVEALSHESVTLRQRACAALALISYDASSRATVVPALKLAAEDESEDVRKAALAALKIIAPEEVTGR